MHPSYERKRRGTADLCYNIPNLPAVQVPVQIIKSKKDVDIRQDAIARACQQSMHFLRKLINHAFAE
jgi:hypothetical protein